MMHTTIYLIIDFTTIIGVTLGIAFIVLAYRRFLKGEFKNILKWVTYAYISIGIYKIIEIIAEYNKTVAYYNKTFYIIRTIFLVSVICAVRSTSLIYKMSKVYGFATVEEKVISFFEKGGKNL